MNFMALLDAAADPPLPGAPAAAVPNNLPVAAPNPYQLAKQQGAPPHVIPYHHGEDEPAHFGFYCMPYTRRDGKEIFVYGERPAVNLAEAAMPREWHRSMDEVLGHPGVYSWILFEGNRFIAAKALTPAEIMSKHKNMYRNRPDNILAAGECRIGADQSVTYNFESGTFMRSIIDNFKYAFGANTDYRPVYRQLMEPLWLAAGAAGITYTDAALIPKSIHQDTPFGNYTRLGYKFHRFDTKPECEAFKERAEGEANVGGGRRTRVKGRKQQKRRSKHKRTYRKRQ